MDLGQPASDNRHPAGKDLGQPASGIGQQATGDRRPAGKDIGQPASDIRHPTTGNRQPATGDRGRLAMCHRLGATKDRGRAIRTILVTAAAIAALASTPALQAAPQAPAEATPMKPAVSLKVDVVLSRWQGEKKVSSLPFSLFVVAPAFTPMTNRSTRDLPIPTGRQSVRMGVDVPVGTSSRVSTSGQTAGSSTTTNTPEYRSVGTSIDGGASQTDDGRFSIFVSVQDTSIFTNDAANTTQIRLADPMAFRTFTMNNTLTMRDGQTLPFAMASDKISGDIIKVDVTLTVLK
jgi:hypothetical protein